MRSQWARRRSSGSATIYLTASATVRRVPPSFVGRRPAQCLREVTVVRHRERVPQSRPETRPRYRRFDLRCPDKEDQRYFVVTDANRTTNNVSVTCDGTNCYIG